MTLTQAEYDALPRRYSYKKTYVPYDVAKMLISEVEPRITSVSKYKKWHKANKVTFVPLNPNRVYPNFSWSDFLDTEIKSYWEHLAEKQRLAAIEYRPMWEAVRWAQQYCRENGITTRKQWLENYNVAEMPTDIPKFPEHTYKKDGYPGFRVWCGKDITGLTESCENTTAVVALVHVANQPQNVVKWVSCNNGVGELRDLWHKQQQYDRLLGCWAVEADTKSHIDNIMANMGATNDDYHTVSNMQQLLWDLNTTLLIVKP